MIFRAAAPLVLVTLWTGPASADPLAWDEKVRRGDALLRYLADPPELHLDPIELGSGGIAIRSTPSVHPGPHRIIRVPPHVASWDLPAFVAKHGEPPGEIVPAGSSITFTDDRDSSPGRDDRLRSRWIVIRQAMTGEWRPASPARWPGTVQGHRNLPRLTSPTVKGMGGIDTPNHLEDLLALGIGHATVNIHLNSLLGSDSRPGTRPHRFEGADYFLDARWLGRLDDTIRFLTANRIVVSAILLVTPPRRDSRHVMIHPEADPAGTLAMPNLTTPEGVRSYAAVLDLLAERYTREDAEFGRVSNWIAHNEVDQAWTWTNMGEQPMPCLLESYHRSMRLIHYAARKYDPHARVFASFTHHWCHPGDGRRTYRTRDMLELLSRLSRAEGDFEWGVAYHPYPQDLLNPRTWEDTQAAFRFDTHKITMKNIEVLAAFLDRPALHFDGRPRPLMLSEQGFHTPGYSEAHQDEQAAALVYAWHKLQALPAIEAFHYHRWFDNPHEGGLKLGLRTLASPGRPVGNPKRAWFVYRDLGSPAEPAATAFAKEILGLDDFATIPHRETIPPEATP